MVRDTLASLGSTNVGLLLARVPAGAWLVMSGFTRFSADGAVDGFAAAAARAMPAWVPQSAAQQYLHVIPYAEIVLGAALVLGIGGRIAGVLASVVLASVILMVTGVRAAGVPMHPNVVLLGVTALICTMGPGTISMDRFMWNPTAGE